MIAASDSTSLLVPVRVDAWVVSAENQQPLARYFADYTRLQSFQSPIPDPFDTSSGAAATPGIHLRWSLPDALTQGRQSSADSTVRFPLVPNRWVVVRFGPTETTRQCAIWVIQSDYLSTGGVDGTSTFLDPLQPTEMAVDVGSGSAQITLSDRRLGRNYTIEAWQAMTDPGGALFLQAVGPGNISFAAYAPFMQDVFSFVDTGLPAEDAGPNTYTYLVLGYYSDPAGDPLHGVNAFDPWFWTDQTFWNSQTPAERFATIADALNWCIDGAAPVSPPSTSLYHGQVAQVQWPYTPPNRGTTSQPTIGVSVANSSIGALAALIASQAEVANEGSTGVALAQLMEAAMLNKLGDYGKPGGSALIEDGIRDAWFGSDLGGTTWTVVPATPQASASAAAAPDLTPAQATALNAQLAALNGQQAELDRGTRAMQSLQSRLYTAWWALAQGTSYQWGMAPVTTPPLNDITAFLQMQLAPGTGTLFSQAWQQTYDVQVLQSQLPNPTDAAEAGAWVAENWSFPGTDATLTLAELGLQLKSGAVPSFSHPNDPVMLFSGLGRSPSFGENGSGSTDGSLACRLPGQLIAGLVIPGQNAINTQTVAGLIDSCSAYTSIPSVPGLLAESVFTDPGSAGLIASAVSGDADAISTAMAALLAGGSTSATWSGTPPLPFATQAWAQAWTPLWLEWELQFYPTGSGAAATRQFSLDDWTFDGSDYTWAGTGFDSGCCVPYKGRTVLTPQAPLFFQAKIEQWLQNNPAIDSAGLEQLIATVGSWDVMSQALSGFTQQLETLLTQEAFPPTPTSDMCVPSPTSGAAAPPIAALIGDGYRAVPMLTGTGLQCSYFHPVRAGLVVLNTLQIVDAFGQTLQAVAANTPQGFQPLLGTGLSPSSLPAGAPYGAFQLPPRLVQGARLDLAFLANDGSGGDTVTSANPNAVCGWVLPNHLDGALAIYDEGGVMLGELIAMPAPGNWRPRPGAPGTDPPPATPADIPNAALRAVVQSIASQPQAVFADLLQTVDETLWMVDPLGGRKDQFLSVLIGRPLAVVQARLQLTLNGLACVNQMWDAMVTPQTSGPASSYSWMNSDGGVGEVSFPVRLGSLTRRDDGLIGYFLPDAAQPYAKFYAVHVPQQLSPDDAYIQAIVNGGSYAGDIALAPQPASPQGPGAGQSVTVTMLLDPRGSVHAYTGILPVAAAALPADVVETFIRALQVTFRTGPILADPDTLRTPKPAEDQGLWNWIQQTAPGTWETTAIVDADDTALLPDANLTLREGWLQLTSLKGNT